MKWDFPKSKRRIEGIDHQGNNRALLYRLDGRAQQINGRITILYSRILFGTVNDLGKPFLIHSDRSRMNRQSMIQDRHQLR
jgi:hypothetical protein